MGSVQHEMKVSVIIPVNNHRNTKNIIEELLRQKKEFPQTEIICVENGSTEDMSFLEDYPVILRHCEKGISRARNLALDIATGDYFCFIDNDDWIPEYYLRVVYERIRTQKDWYIWQWWADDRLVDMFGLDLKHPLKTQWALWGYCWSRKLFDGVRFDLNDVLGDRKVFDIITDQTNGEFIEKPMYRYWWNGNDNSVCHIINRGGTV